MTEFKDRGLVLAFHCVPQNIAPEVEAYWAALREALRVQGQDLLLITTAVVKNDSLPHLRLPFELDRYTLDKKISSGRHEHPLIESLQSWYGFSRDKSQLVYLNVKRFYEQLLDAIEPAAVLSWQSIHPTSQIVREACLTRGLPWWSCERGWVRETLMVDSGHNNFMTETTSSLGLHRAYEQYKTNLALIEKYKQKTRALQTIERYPKRSKDAEKSIRQGLQLAAGQKIYALMTHGEPHVGAIPGLYGLQRQHALEPGQLQTAIEKVATYLANRGDYLVVKEHPFNLKYQRTLRTEGLPNTVTTQSSIDELDAMVDGYLFTLSTLQFETALKGKPFGLLSRGPLSGPSQAPCLHDFDAIDNFFQEIETPKSWQMRSAEIDRKISFYLENFLLDLCEEQLGETSRLHARHLQQFTGLAQTTAWSHLETWLQSMDL
jgi:hypothetical protein